MTRKYVVPVLVAVVVVAILATSLVSAEVPAAPQAPDAAPNPEHPGFYLVGWKSLDTGDFHHAGEMQFISWAGLEPGDNSYNWSQIDSFLDQHYEPGKGIGFAITTYDARGSTGILQMPEWARIPGQTVIEGGTPEDARNGTFASGLTSWSYEGQVSAPTVDGSQVARIGGIANTTSRMWQSSLRIPYGLVQGGTNRVTFRWRVDAAGADTGDSLQVQLFEGSELVATALGTSNTGGDTGWKTATLNLEPYEGHWTSLEFTVANNGTAPHTAFYVEDVSFVTQPWIPKYWDQAYLDRYRDLIEALGNRYRNDTRIEFFGIGTGTYGETRASDYTLSSSDYDDREATKSNGLTSELWVETVNKITNYYVNAFSQGGSLRKVLLLQNAPYQFHVSEREEFSDFAAEQGVGLSYNGLYWDWDFAETTSYPESGSERGTAAYDPSLRYWEDVPVGFETYPYMLGTTGSDGVGSDRFYWGVLNALDKHSSYIRLSSYTFGSYTWYIDISNDRPVAEFAEIMRWAAPYFGAQIEDPDAPRYTPSVWVALREHISPFNWHYNGGGSTRGDRWPPLGNFEFWLEQLDNIAGGQTIPQTHFETTYTGQQPEMGSCNVGPDGYACFPNSVVRNTDLPSVADAMTIRRTDQASGNPLMFFDINDYYMGELDPDVYKTGVYEAEITVTYWDHGNDRFRLRYDSQSGPKYATPRDSGDAWVKKNNSNQFLEAVFHITDGVFENGIPDINGSPSYTDFTIDSRDQNGVSDGDEWIHFVDVRKIDRTRPTPTPTPTRTPTPTPTQLPTVGGISGKVFVDSNGNGAPDSGEPALPGARVELLSASGSVISSATANATGNYNFQNLAPATYSVRPVPTDDHFARPEERTAQVSAGANTTVNLPHYEYLRLYMPVTLKGLK